MRRRNDLLIIAYLLAIESSHNILFRNRDEIVEKIGPFVTTAQQALVVADQIDTWVTNSLVLGEVVIPKSVLYQILEQLKNPRNNAEICNPVLNRYGLCP